NKSDCEDNNHHPFKIARSFTMNDTSRNGYQRFEIFFKEVMIAENGRHAKEAADGGKYCKNNKRHFHNSWRFMQVMFLIARSSVVSKESKKQHSEHIEGS